ncbi:MAG: antibiotic biosynthesis monooxygenase family protein [Oleiphilaceae bacterium]|nr:antibiotic biosynthesis monooxygenase family protein [Oleiphilaceae bacterium]
MIRVIIERQIAETLEAAYEQRARSVLQQAVEVPGFISGESLKNSNNPNHRVILSTWRSAADWYRWYQSQERRSMMAELNPMLDGQERIMILEHAENPRGPDLS